MINNLQTWGSLVLAGISLLISIISMLKASKAQSLQNKVNELELTLKQYELEKISLEQKATKIACVEARIIKLGRDQYRIKLWNSGGANALNVNIEVDNCKELIVIKDDRLPFEILEPNKSIEVPVITGFGASKFKITTKWNNELGENEHKEQYVSL